MTRLGPHSTMAEISTPRSQGSLVPGPRNIAPVTQCSIAIGCVGKPFVSKTPDYVTARSHSSAAPSATKTVRNPFYP